jgi:hypothetical protein
MTIAWLWQIPSVYYSLCRQSGRDVYPMIPPKNAGRICDARMGRVTGRFDIMISDLYNLNCKCLAIGFLIWGIGLMIRTHAADGCVHGIHPGIHLF